MAWDIGAFAYQAPGQFARPTSDTSLGGWTDHDMGTLEIYGWLADALDNTYIQSPVAPTDAEYTCGLNAVSAPVAGSVVMRVRAAWVT